MASCMTVDRTAPEQQPPVTGESGGNLSQVPLPALARTASPEPAAGAPRPPGGSRWPLVALCVGTAVAEALVLLALGVRSGLGLAPQVSAPAPLGLFHDLRWLIVYQDSWLGFAFEVLAVLVLRSALTAWTVRAAWPDEVPFPSWRRLMARCLVFTVVAGLLLAPWTILLFGMAVVSISWLFFAAVPSVLVLSLLLSNGSISGDWWRRTPAWRALGWLALSFLAATLASALVSLSPSALAVPVAAATGLFNALAWLRIVQAVASRSPARTFRPVAPAAIAAFLAIVVVGTSIGFSSVRKPGAPSAAPAGAAGAAGAPASGDGRPVLVASGFWSSWDGRAKLLLPGNFDERRFSYRGLGPERQPLPYASGDTRQSLARLDALMAEQVQALHRQTHRLVSIVGESEGALVAKSYLVTHPGAPVSTVVFLSPLVSPGRVYYPPAGSGGWGLAGGLGWEGMNATVSTMTSVDLAPDQPLMRSIVADAPAMRTLLGCPLPGVRQFALLPLADAVASPGTASLGMPAAVLPAFHGGMLGDRAAQAAVRQVLEGSNPRYPTWSALEDVIRPAAAAWEVPDLPPAINPAWDLGSGRPAPDHPLGCSTIRALLSSGVAGS
jgi:hypothetical protein